MVDSYAHDFENLSGISHKTLIAVLLSVLSAVLTSLGLVFMKYSHNKYFAETKKKLANPIVNKFWMGGLIITSVGSVIYIPALYYGNQILLASSCSMSIIFNLLFAISILKERLLPSDLLGILLICLGSILFLYAAKNGKNQKVYTEDDLPWLLTRPISIVFCAISLIYFIGSQVLENVIMSRIEIFFGKALEYQVSFYDSSQIILRHKLNAIDIANKEVSGEIKTVIKYPLIFQTISAGLQGSIGTSFLKVFTI